MENNPDIYSIGRAEHAAVQSPCVKSKRGAAVYGEVREQGTFYANMLLSAASNGPPSPMTCLGSEECKRDCNKRCVHAEGRALREALFNIHSPMVGGRLAVADLKMIHVKIGGDGKVVPGGGPSCWQCSREILDSGIAGIWLHEWSHGPNGDQGRWNFYPSKKFHEITLQTCDII